MTSNEQLFVGECKMFSRNDNFNVVRIVLLINDRC